MNVMVKYLHDVASLEAQLYTQNQIVASLNGKIKGLGIAKRYTKPTYSELKFKNLFYVDWRFPFENDFLVILGAILTFAITFIGLVCNPLNAAADMKWVFDFVDFVEKSLGQSFLLSLILIPIGVIACLVSLFLPHVLKCFLPCVILSNILDHIQAKKYYAKHLAEYDESVHKDTQRVQKELALKQVFQSQLQEVQQKRSATTSALTALYDIGVIHPKYRHNIIAVSSFYDYFDTGRCFSFSGPGGAYDTYEQDLRFRRLETKLDVIITRLDEIIDNQRMLSDLMRDANNTLSRIERTNKKMMGSMSRIERNSEITAYNTRCTMESATVLEHIAVYNTLRN